MADTRSVGKAGAFSLARLRLANRGLTACILATIAMGAPMNQAEAALSRTTLHIRCKVIQPKGEPKLTRPSQACTQIKQRVAEIMGQRANVVSSARLPSHGDWISISIEQKRSVTLTARILASHRGERRSHPEIAIDVMDRAIKEQDLESFSRAIADAAHKLLRHP